MTEAKKEAWVSTLIHLAEIIVCFALAFLAVWIFPDFRNSIGATVAAGIGLVIDGVLKRARADEMNDFPDYVNDK